MEPKRRSTEFYGNFSEAAVAFKANHPFIFVVVDQITLTTLFIGRYDH